MKSKALTLKQFCLLFLAKVADNTQIIDLKDSNNKICSIPANYKQNIQNILTQTNGWQEEFSKLIDTQEYFKNHFMWEYNLATALKETLKDLNKKYEYDFTTDCIMVNFKQPEIDAILSKFPKTRVSEMDHFSRLVKAHMFTREYQEMRKELASSFTSITREYNK